MLTGYVRSAEWAIPSRTAMSERKGHLRLLLQLQRPILRPHKTASKVPTLGETTILSRRTKELFSPVSSLFIYAKLALFRTFSSLPQRRQRPASSAEIKLLPLTQHAFQFS